MKRPNEFMDAMALEDWAIERVPYLFDEWELSDVCEYISFWEYVEKYCPEEMRDFEDWFKENGDVYW